MTGPILTSKDSSSNKDSTPTINIVTGGKHIKLKQQSDQSKCPTIFVSMSEGWYTLGLSPMKDDISERNLC